MNQTQQGQKLAQIRTYLDELMERSTPSQPVWNQEAVLENKPPQWSYIDGCMLMAVLCVYVEIHKGGYTGESVSALFFILSGCSLN